MNALLLGLLARDSERRRTRGWVEIGSKLEPPAAVCLSSTWPELACEARAWRRAAKLDLEGAEPTRGQGDEGHETRKASPCTAMCAMESMLLFVYCSRTRYVKQKGALGSRPIHDPSRRHTYFMSVLIILRARPAGHLILHRAVAAGRGPPTGFRPGFLRSPSMPRNLSVHHRRRLVKRSDIENTSKKWKGSARGRGIIVQE